MVLALEQEQPLVDLPARGLAFRMALERVYRRALSSPRGPDTVSGPEPRLVRGQDDPLELEPLDQWVQELARVWSQEPRLEPDVELAEAPRLEPDVERAAAPRLEPDVERAVAPVLQELELQLLK